VLASPAAAVAGANILIVSGHDIFGPSGGYPSTTEEAAGVLNTELTTAGNTVTVVTTGVPANLTGYTQIYDVRFDNATPFTSAEMGYYLTFLQAAPNNTLFLMGENTYFNTRNGLILQFIAQAGGGTIALPVANNINTGTGAYEPETVASQFATTPNVISTVTFADCGLMTTAGTGAFATSQSAGGCSIFFGRGALQNAPQGAVVVVLDVNFIATAPTGFGAANEVAFRQNLEHFVSDPPVAPPSTPVPNTLILLALGLCSIGIIAIRRRAFA
jgi:hypothetical protein